VAAVESVDKVFDVVLSHPTHQYQQTWKCSHFNICYI